MFSFFVVVQEHVLEFRSIVQISDAGNPGLRVSARFQMHVPELVPDHNVQCQVNEEIKITLDELKNAQEC